MAGGRKGGLQTLVLIAALLTFILLGVIGYMRFDDVALGEREAIDSAIASAKQSNNLKSDEEALLRLQLAIVDYMAKHSMPPASLYDLVPVYFDMVPRNPKTKKDYFYERDGRRYTLRLSEEDRVMVASLSTKDSENALRAETFLGEGDEEDFVNPNTLEEEIFIYDPTKKRDPFLPFDLSPQVMSDSPLTPLERYSVEQLRLTAVLDDVTGGGDRTAIVENAVGKGFTVRPGTKIGNAGGVVVSIEADRLKILESHVDFTGEEVQKVAELIINKAPGGDSEKNKKRRRRNRR